MIHNIVFDMGGVLYRFEPDIAFREYPGEDGQLLYDAIFASSDWRRQDLGEINEDELISLVSERVPKRLQAAVPRIVRWYDLTGAVCGMQELTKELSERGFSLYLLSNVGFAFYRYRDRIPSIRLFKGQFISAEHGLLKPDPAIFRRFFDTFGLSAEDCLFIDDTVANVEGARSVGMEAVAFQNAEQLREHLCSLGIL